MDSIHINESYPNTNSTKQEQEAKKQLLSASKAKIGFQYEEGSVHKGKSDVKYESDSAEDGGRQLLFLLFVVICIIYIVYVFRSNALLVIITLKENQKLIQCMYL